MSQENKKMGAFKATSPSIKCVFCSYKTMSTKSLYQHFDILHSKEGLMREEAIMYGKEASERLNIKLKEDYKSAKRAREEDEEEIDDVKEYWKRRKLGMSNQQVEEEEEMEEEEEEEEEEEMEEEEDMEEITIIFEKIPKSENEMAEGEEDEEGEGEQEEEEEEGEQQEEEGEEEEEEEEEITVVFEKKPELKKHRSKKHKGIKEEEQLKEEDKNSGQLHEVKKEDEKLNEEAEKREEENQEKILQQRIQARIKRKQQEEEKERLNKEILELHIMRQLCMRMINNDKYKRKVEAMNRLKNERNQESRNRKMEDPIPKQSLSCYFCTYEALSVDTLFLHFDYVHSIRAPIRKEYVFSGNEAEDKMEQELKNQEHNKHWKALQKCLFQEVRMAGTEFNEESSLVRTFRKMINDMGLSEESKK